MKKHISLILFIILVFSLPITASAEWQEKDGQKLWYNSDGTAATGFKNIDGTGYMFSSNGYLQGKYTGCTSSSKGRRYYFNGELVKNRLVDVGDEQYYAGEDGYFLERRKCYLNGELVKNSWVDVGDERYYAGEDGYFLVGWQKFPDGFLYGFDENGTLIKTTRPDFCKTEAQATEYHGLKNAEYCLSDWYYEHLYNSIELVRDETGVTVGEEDGKDVRMLVRFWAKSEEAVKEILDELERSKIDSKYYDIVVGEKPDDRLGTPDSELYDKDDITLSMKIDAKKITVTVENETDLEYNLIEDIKIEMLDGDEWVTLPRKDIGDVRTLQTLAANGSATITDSFPPNGYGGDNDNFKSGTYRAIVEIQREESKILHIYKTIKLASQIFTIE